MLKNYKIQNDQLPHFPDNTILVLLAYTSFLLCQDYTNKDGKKQDFSILDVTLENVKCNGAVVSKDGAAKGSIFYVYDDVAGIITGEGNDPHVVAK